MNSDNPHNDAHTAFDEAARRAHAASLDRLSPRVQAQLTQRRRAALTQEARPALRTWPMLALGSAAALTLAVALFVVRGNGDAELPATSDNVATAPAPGNDTTPSATTPAVEPSTTTSTTAHIPPAPAVASTDVPDATVDSDTVESVGIDDDVLPAELLAAELNTADDAMGFGMQEESPDFYLWLGSQDAQADVTESL
jgi:hypothetical protein